MSRSPPFVLIVLIILKDTNASFCVPTGVCVSQKWSPVDTDRDQVKKKKDDEWLYEVNRLIQWSNSKGIMYDITSGYESNLCEHISFHYCLNYQAGITMSIARDAKLYYFALNDVLINPDDNPRRKRKRDKLRKKRFDPLRPLPASSYSNGF
eukprot:1005636_1